MNNLLKRFFESKLKLIRGTRFVSFCFIAFSVIIAAGFLFAANMYYNIDTREVVMEEVYRVTGVIRATAGLIVGGTESQDPSSDYVFEVVGSTKLATTTVATGPLELTAADQVLRFSGGTSFYVGFKAPTTTTSTVVYTLPDHGAYPPNSDYLLSWQTGDQLTWMDPREIGIGTITAVGNVISGAAFTVDGTQGTSLWFYQSETIRGQLTRATLTGNRTYTLPNLTGTIALQSASALTAGGVLFANGGLIVQNSNFTYGDNRLQVGSNGIRLLGGNNTYIGLRAATTSDNRTYIWPANDGGENYILTTDGSGNLTWESLVGAGGVQKTGAPEAGWVSYFVDENTITGDTNFTWSTSTNMLTLGGGLITSLIKRIGGDLTIQTETSGDIILDPASGRIKLVANTWIETDKGYQIGKAGTEILREMIPILGFDLPVRCGTACQGTATTVSRTIEDYPFSSVATGTERIHKFVIRYADSTTTASSTWTVWDEDLGVATSTFEVPHSASTDLGKGEAYITPSVTILTNTNDWHLRVQVPAGVTIQIYQIFLVAYDKVL